MLRTYVPQRLRTAVVMITAEARRKTSSKRAADKRIHREAFHRGDGGRKAYEKNQEPRKRAA